jgi:signal transduction histidine kinase
MLLAQAAHAATQGSDQALAALGPWLFASVALVALGAVSWWLGLLMGRRQGRLQRTAQEAARPAPKPLPARASGHARTAGDATSAPTDAEAISYALSHDLRAPLRVIEGFARILKEDYGRQLDRIGNDHLDRLLGASARMNAMIEAMLSLARLSTQPLTTQPVDLTAMAHDVMLELRRQQPERAVRVDIAPGLMAQGDPTLLRQVMDNLLSNAWKYSAKVAQASISLRARDRDADGRTVFEVADNGAGFDMRAAGKLFGLFQRLHGQTEFPGTGIGLASVQRIVLRHGGRIWAESEPGRGARFCFSLPG